jgi:hypothetical protein
MSCEIGFPFFPTYTRSLSADVTAPVDPTVNTTPPSESPPAADSVAVHREPSPVALSTGDSNSTDSSRERAAEPATPTPAASSQSSQVSGPAVRSPPASIGSSASGAAARAGALSSAFDPSRFNPAELTYVVRKPPDANSIASSIAAGATPTYTSEYYRLYRHPPPQAPHGPSSTPAAQPTPAPPGDQSAALNAPAVAATASASSSAPQAPSQPAPPANSSSNAGGSVIATYTAIHKLSGVEFLAKVCVLLSISPLAFLLTFQALFVAIRALLRGYEIMFQIKSPIITKPVYS